MTASTLAHLSAALLSDVGNVRTVNEDAGRVVRPDHPGLMASKGLLVVIADGMGGHNGGEVASRIAVEAVPRAYYTNSGAPGEALARAVAQANRAIYRTAREDARFDGMGTTCTALAILDGEAVCAHVGDTRVYLVRDAQAYTMIEDHSSVRAMEVQGAIDHQQARRHADRHVLLRAVGTHPDVEVSSWQQSFPVRAGDRFVVCTDGLYTLVADEELGQIVSGGDPEHACAQLVALAKERGGDDNITVAVIAS